MSAISLPNCNIVLAQTSPVVAGIIASDTTWTRAGSPYILSEKVTISSNVQLTLEQGVIVNLNGNCIEVNGTLIAKGAQDLKIFFKTGSIILNSKNSIIENAVFTDSIGITINSGSPVISNSYIKGGLTLSGGSPLINSNIIDTRVMVTDGSPTISNNIISDGIHADARGGPVTISNNQITSKNGFTVIYVQGIHANIVGNKIVGNNEMGIYAWLRITSFSITNNQISNCTIGIRADAGAGAEDVSILKNVILNNDEGLHLWGHVNVKENTITENRVGVSATHSVFSNNNFQNNSQLNMENMWLADIDATNNWWGTTDTQSINQTIFDKKNDSIDGQVLFDPFLSKPNPDAPQIPENNPIIMPTVPPEPTATPTPTAQPEPTVTVTSSVEPKNVPFPTVIVIAVLVTITIIACAGAFVYLKRRK